MSPLPDLAKRSEKGLLTAINSWDDAAFVDIVIGTGRPELLLAGLWTETCVALPAIQALADGYEVYIVEDCCGDISALVHENAKQRMLQAGARPVTAKSVLLEWQRDWALLDTGDAVREIMHAHRDAHGATFAPCPAARKAPQPVMPGYVADALG